MATAEMVVHEDEGGEVRVSGPLAGMLEQAPAVVLAAARDAAKALANVIAQKPKKVVMNGEQYLEFEDWQTVARFYGVTAAAEHPPQFVEFGEVRGFMATAVALKDGRVISRATAYCLTDEEKWRSRAKYEYHYVRKSGGTSAEDPGRDELVWEEKSDGKRFPKKLRVRVADEPVPLFQLASMAQTRASAKALRNVLSWVVVLAGYRPTPAEELPDAMEVPVERAESRPSGPRPAPAPASGGQGQYEQPPHGREPGSDDGDDMPGWASEPSRPAAPSQREARPDCPEGHPAAKVIPSKFRAGEWYCLTCKKGFK